MSSTKLSKADLKELLRATMARLPHMTFDREFQEATLDDWLEDAQPVGLSRFSEGVKRARSYSEFFPHRSLIRKMIPETRNENLALMREMQDLRQRKAAGEKFYTLTDVLLEFSQKVIAGELKGSDKRGQELLNFWAKKLQHDAKEFAAKMLATGERIRKAEAAQ